MKAKSLFGLFLVRALNCGALVIAASVCQHGIVLGQGSEPEPANRPNFIFLITDDISAEDLGCYGNHAIRTPNLDRMAAEGVVF